uniref:Cytochrome P450 n=1 Tax=Nothapodytes nimmoniana TaxID=159386 RepID=A0A7L7RB84_NOTNI|nr:cytochrome P450 [Nothapodytes nimmoniana]
MEMLYFYLIFLVSVLLIFKHIFHFNKSKLPPSPPYIPIIGHLYLIKGSIHQALQSLSSKYGPILFLRLGVRSMLVVSSPSAVEECFTKNDIIFANRPRTLAGDLLTYNYRAFVWTPYGHIWRSLRRLSVVELFSSTSVHRSSAVREDEIRTLVRHLYKVSKSGNPKVEFKYWFSICLFNTITRIVAGRQVVPEEDAGGEAGRRIMADLRERFFTNVGMNMCDFLPILRWFGYKGLEKKLMVAFKRRDEFLQGLLDEFRLKKMNSSSQKHVKDGKEKGPLIETLLSLRESEPEFYTVDVIKSLMLVMFVAGTETTATTVEWAMSLLLTHPETLDKLRTEIDNNVREERLLTDMDLSKLPYLRCVINEALRLYPPVPLLLPHFSSKDCTIGGHVIPEGTILVVNSWALQRDPNVWEEPHKFKPERFEMEEEKEGFGYKFVPFGVGRRACPGVNMGMRAALLALGTLIQCFEWEKVGQFEMEMRYNNGVTLQKAKPFEANCKPRQNFVQLLGQL